MNSQHNTRALLRRSDGKASTRQCLPCTACCEGWLRIEVNNEEIYPGNGCSNCEVGKGCRIYEKRPVDPCRSFVCGWREENSPLPDWLMPNNAKVIVLPNKFNWQGNPVDVAVPVGKRIPPRALRWLTEYALKNQRLLVYLEQEITSVELEKKQLVFAYGPSLFRQEIEVKVREGTSLWL